MSLRALVLATSALALVIPQASPLRADDATIQRPAAPASMGVLDAWLTGPAVAGTLAQAEVASTTGCGVLFSHRKPARAGVVLEGRRRRSPREHRDLVPESYVILKGGGLHVSEEPSAEGLYFGGEIGGSVEGVLDFGFSLDYFHRSSSEMMVLRESAANDLPVRAEVTLEESSAHLIPLGVTVRARLPLGSERITPFVSGTLAYEILYLQNEGTLDPSDPIQAILEREETFSGIGWQAAAGVSLGLSPSIGLFGEAGLHRGSPKQEIELDGLPVDLKVDLDGTFLRGGVRVTL